MRCVDDARGRPGATGQGCYISGIGTRNEVDSDNSSCQIDRGTYKAPVKCRSSKNRRPCTALMKVRGRGPSNIRGDVISGPSASQVRHFTRLGTLIIGVCPDEKLYTREVSWSGAYNT